MRDRALDANSYGVSRQREMRDKSSSDGYVEPNLWTGIGKARSGCGAALVGNPDQIIEKLHRYMDMGIRSFIFSGYPNIDECYRFADLVLPRLKTFQCLKNKERLMKTFLKPLWQEELGFSMIDLLIVAFLLSGYIGGSYIKKTKKC